ncbi:MAG: methyltransferase, partial [bacterium]|nr:methyltransferase [bacterium]
QLGIADLLAQGPLTTVELAALTKSHEPSLYRVMRALAGVGIFSQCDGDSKSFELTPMAEFLKSGMLRSAAILFNAPWSDEAWKEFLNSVRTGETAFENAHNAPLPQWLQENPDAAKIFNEANAVKAAGTFGVIVENYDFSRFHLLTDVGGGTGALMAEILTATPSLKGILADLPGVLEDAAAFINSRGLDGRCELRECDFFQSVPTGSDVYLLSNVLHDWDDYKCLKILENCRKAMKPGAILLIVEMVVPPGNQPSVS